MCDLLHSSLLSSTILKVISRYLIRSLLTAKPTLTGKSRKKKQNKIVLISKAVQNKLKYENDITIPDHFYTVLQSLICNGKYVT